jgi:hypothetical protein
VVIGPDDLIDRIGTLSSERMEEVEHALRLARIEDDA